MSVSFSYLDKALLNKPLNRMSPPERELLKVRLSQAVDAIKESGFNSEVLGLMLLEREGVVAEGTVENAINSVEIEPKKPNDPKASVFAHRASLTDKQAALREKEQPKDIFAPVNPFAGNWEIR